MSEPRRAKILVIDDEACMLRAVERILAPDHDVTCAATPAEGLTLVHASIPDLVICVIGMPRMHLYLAMAALNQMPADFQQQAAS